MIKKLVVAGILGSFSVLAQAEDTYLSLQHISMQYKDKDVDGVTFRPNIMVLKFGQEVTDYFAVEARIGHGLNDDGQYNEPFPAIAAVSSSIPPFPGVPAGYEYYKSSIGLVYGLYAKFFAEFGEGVVIKPYISVGYGSVDVELVNGSRKVLAANSPAAPAAPILVNTPVVDQGIKAESLQTALGIDYRISQGFALNVEYLNLYKKSQTKLNGISFGITFSF